MLDTSGMRGFRAAVVPILQLAHLHLLISCIELLERDWGSRSQKSPKSKHEGADGCLKYHQGNEDDDDDGDDVGQDET